MVSVFFDRKRALRTASAATVAAILLSIPNRSAHAQQVQGPSSSRTPYIVPTSSMVDKITSIVTTTDLVQKTGAAPGITYEVGGVPDGLGVIDNGATFTVLMNHEIPNGLGVTRDHGAAGAYVSQYIINKSTLAVVSGHDLIQNVFGWNSTSQSSETVASTVAFQRFCSADLAPTTAFYNAATGLGTQERIFMNGEEVGTAAHERQQGTVATGPNAGNSYTLGKFNLDTNGSGITNAFSSEENGLANPFSQNKTVVISNSDGGTGIYSNAVAVYQGTKQATGTEVDKAGLTNGTLKFINVAGNTAEITDTTNRTTAITSGTAFTLGSTTSTTFSRPEDGAWDPNHPNQFYFVTTDRLDGSTAAGGGQTNPTAGATNSSGQIGKSRLWRLNFSDITNPDLGGTIDLLIDGGKPNQKVNMFDNMTIDNSGHVFLNEDPGNSNYNGKIWEYDTNSSDLTMLTKFDPSRWGDLTSATSPHTDDKETSGILDVTSMFTSNPFPGEAYLLTVVQDHSSNPAVADALTTEGGQLLLVHVVPEPATISLLAAGATLLLGRARRRK